jgi:capsule polysaccharide export protein KpsE/RkpR
MVRYNRIALGKVISTLQEWVDQTQETLDNAESADYPNEDRIDTLQTRIDSLQESVDALDNID